MTEPEITAYAIPGPAGSAIRVERVAGGWAVLSGPWRIGRDGEAAWEPQPRALATPARVALLEQLERIRILHNAIHRARG